MFFPATLSAPKRADSLAVWSIQTPISWMISVGQEGMVRSVKVLFGLSKQTDVAYFIVEATYQHVYNNMYTALDSTCLICVDF